jgi:hypothetical protein
MVDTRVKPSRDRAAPHLPLRLLLSLKVGPNSPQLRRYTSQSDNSTRGVGQREPCLFWIGFNCALLPDLEDSFQLAQLSCGSVNGPV